MNKARFFIVFFLVIFLTFCKSTSDKAVKKEEVKKTTDAKKSDSDKVIIVEAESYTNEQGGSLQKITDRPGTSNNTCISYWNDFNHAVEWNVDIPNDGEYKIILRYAHARAWDAYRDLQIDKKILNNASKKITLKATGGFGRAKEEWKNILITEENNSPAIFSLTKGRHTIRISILQSSFDNGSANLDFIAILQKDVDPAVVDNLTK